MNPKASSKFEPDFSLNNYSVLIVDDNPINLSVIVDYLRSFGLTTLVSQDGNSSLKRAKYAKPGIILLDILMPGIDGYQTCINLKQDPETKDIPVIFMTALSSIEDKVKGFKVGAVDYITKPIQPEEVLARIELHLKLRHLTQVQNRQNELLGLEIEQRKTIQTKLVRANHQLKKEVRDRLSAQAALKTINKELEHRVGQRTVLLAQSNRHLKEEVVEHRNTAAKLQKTALKLQNSLSEKEVLLKEIYHRVKNNLLVVSSLLEMQTDYVEDPEIVKMLRNSQDRINSMALVHEQLYCSENLQEIDLGAYIEALLEKISESHSNQEKDISLIRDLVNIRLNIETVNSCGLIVNELVTNALEHGFVGKNKGNIWVNLCCDHALVTLTVKDDGVGVPPDFDLDRSDSLGLKLVQILTTQLEGEIELDLSQGTAFHLTFSELNYCDRI